MSIPRLVAVFAGALLIWLANGFIATALFGEGYSLPGHVFRAVSTAVLVAALLWLVLRRWPLDIGLRPTVARFRRFGVGGAAYAVPFAIGAAVILGLSLATLRVDAAALIPQALAVVALVLLFEAIPEELIFRGVIFGTLREKFPTWVTIIAQALLFCLFGALIGAALDVERQVLFFTFSIALGVIRAATGSVYATIGFHLVFQLVTQLTNGPQWTSVQLDDPELWFRDVAFFLAPLVLGQLVVGLGALAWRRRRA